jgi:hypothetical protein
LVWHLPPEPRRHHLLAVPLGHQRAINGVDLGIRVLIQHHLLGRRSVGSLHPLQADGGRVDEQQVMASPRVAEAGGP